jgi:hypothetical protein
MNLIELGRAVTVFDAQNIDGVVQNTIVETLIYPAPTIPGGVPPGTGGRLEGSLLGTYTCGAAAPSLTIRFKYGGVTTVTHVIVFGGAVAVTPLTMWWALRRRPIVAGGGGRLYAVIVLNDPTLGALVPLYHKIVAGTAAVSGAVDQPFNITAQWSIAAVAHSLVTEHAQMIAIF